MESRRVGRSGLDVSTDRSGHHDLGPGHRRGCGGRPVGGVRLRRRHAGRHSERLRRRGCRVDPRHARAGRRAPLGGAARHHDGRRRRWSRAAAGHPGRVPGAAAAPTPSTSGRCTGSTIRCPSEETCSALRRAVASGRAAYVGVSGVTGWQLATVAAEVRRLSPGDRGDQRGERVLAAGARIGGVGAAGRRRARGRAAGLGAARPGRAHRQVPPRHAGRLPRRLTAFRSLRGPSPDRARRPGWSRPWPPPPRVSARHRWRSPARGRATGRASPPSFVGARDRAQLLGSLAAESLVLPDEIRAALDDVSEPGERTMGATAVPRRGRGPA